MGSILHDKEFGAGLHNPQAEGDDLHREEEVDHHLLVGLDERADHAEGGEEQVLERARLEDRVQERVEVERDVGEQERRAVCRGANKKNLLIWYKICQHFQIQYQYDVIQVVQCMTLFRILTV